VWSPAPGLVQVVVLAKAGSGAPAQATLDAVSAALNAEDVRPLTDTVEVVAVVITEYAVDAQITVYPGPDPELVLEAAVAALQDWADAHHALGEPVTRAGMTASLYQSGVKDVSLAQPLATIPIASSGAPYLTGGEVRLLEDGRLWTAVLGRNEDGAWTTEISWELTES